MTNPHLRRRRPRGTTRNAPAYIRSAVGVARHSSRWSLLLIGILVLAVSACSSHEERRATAHAESRLTAGTNVQVNGSTNILNHEVSAAYVPTSATPSATQGWNWAIAINNARGNSRTAPRGVNGWAYSNEGGATTWTALDQTNTAPTGDNFGGWGVPAENPTTFNGYEGDPVLVYTGNTSQVAYISMGSDTVRGVFSDVIVARSNDGGKTFGNVHLIVDPGTTGAGTLGAPIDQPYAVKAPNQPFQGGDSGGMT